MNRLLLLLVLTACRNDAITYARSLAADSDVECHALNTEWDSHRGVDTAICTILKRPYFCKADVSGSYAPTCVLRSLNDNVEK